MLIDGFEDVRDPVSHGEVIRCWGPDATGGCPDVRDDGVIACAGHRIAPFYGGPESWLAKVPENARQCPLSNWLMATS